MKSIEPSGKHCNDVFVAVVDGTEVLAGEALCEKRSVAARHNRMALLFDVEGSLAGRKAAASGSAWVTALILISETI